MVVVVMLLWISFALLVFHAACARRVNARKPAATVAYEPIEAIVTSREDVGLLRKCVISLRMLSPIKKIWLCLDRPSITDEEEIRNWDICGIEVIVNRGDGGKIPTQLLGVEAATSRNILLVDADIVVELDSEGLGVLLSWQREQRVDFLCAYSRGRWVGARIWPAVLECDRIMRQQVLRAGRDVFGLSNLTGYFLVAVRDSYRKVAQHKLQDDVAATMNVIREGLVVRTFPMVACAELERPALWSSVIQRARWTYGNIMLLPNYVRGTLRLGFPRGLMLLSTPYMWYGMHYIAFLAIIMLFVEPGMILALSLICCLMVQGIILHMTSQGMLRLWAILLYLLLWPLYSVVALLLGIAYRVCRLEAASRFRGRLQ